jgi:hypothetical protein
MYHRFSLVVRVRTWCTCTHVCLCARVCVCSQIVWNVGDDNGCNFKCDTAGGPIHKEGEQAIVVRPGKSFCSRPNPPPPPPLPPTPANLCPPSMPEDWRGPCLGGDLFYQSGDDHDTTPDTTILKNGMAAESLHPEAESRSLSSPSSTLMPIIGNGHLATFVQSGACTPPLFIKILFRWSW